MKKKKSSKDKYYKEAPQLPCEVYKAIERETHIPLVMGLLMCVISVCVFVFSEDKSLGFFVLFGAFSLAFSSKFKGYGTKRVYLTPETISVDHRGMDIEEDSLDRYELRLHQKITGTQYRYEVFIRPKKSESKSFLLVEGITCPINLREWVDGVQNQFAQPIPISFASEQVERDYKTGIYKSKKRRSL